MVSHPAVVDSYCKLYFTTLVNLQDEQKVAHTIRLLTGKALTWATSVLDKEGENIANYNHFIQLLR